MRISCFLNSKNKELGAGRENRTLAPVKEITEFSHSVSPIHICLWRDCINNNNKKKKPKNP